MTSRVNITVGCDGSEAEEEYTSANITCLCKQEKVNAINNRLKQTLKEKRVPFLVIETSKFEKQIHSLQLFGEQFEVSTKVVEQKSYTYGSFKNKQRTLTLKKVQKIFHLLTTLPNFADISLNFYKVGNWIDDKLPNVGEVLNKLRVKGELELDSQTLSLFKQCIGKVSPQFLDSPIIALLELFVLFNFNIELQNFDLLEQSTKNAIEQNFGMRENKERLFSPNELKGEIKIYFTLEQLFSIELSGPCKLLERVIKLL